jgi:peroxiredoxin
MRRMGAFVFVVLVGILLFGCESTENGDSNGIQRESSIDFTLYDLEGVKRTLSEQKGKVVLVDFWATFCPPCKVEIPHLKAIYKEYKDKGLVVWGIGLEKRESLEPFVNELNISYPILLDDLRSVSAKYGVQGIPTTILFDKKSRIAFKHVGFGPGLEMKFKEEIEILLKE